MAPMAKAMVGRTKSVMASDANAKQMRRYRLDMLDMLVVVSFLVLLREEEVGIQRDIPVRILVHREGDLLLAIAVSCECCQSTVRDEKELHLLLWHCCTLLVP